MNNIYCTTLNITLLMIFVLSGCSNTPKTGGYETIRDKPNRNSAIAKKENQRAVLFLNDKLFDEAEKALKKALEADLTYGVAHNNLGKVYYHQKKWYLAAWEFQYAIKLMPNQPEPRNNLGMVFEEVGKLDDAVTAYSQAVELEPDNPQLIGNLVRARIRRGDRGDEVRVLLSDLIMRETRPEWLSWARDRLSLMGATHQTEVDKHHVEFPANQ